MEYMIVILISAVTAGMVSLVMGVVAYFLIKKILSDNIETAALQKTASASDIQPTAIQNEVDYIDQNALLETSTDTSDASNSNDKEQAEQQDESDILTGSDLSKHLPNNKKFGELNIPTLEEISVAELDSNDVAPSSAPNKPEPIIQPELILTDIPSNLTEDQNDDEATVLMHRKPPE